MNKELQDKLYAKYPALFAQKDLSPRETLMCWGIDVGDGWYNIMDALCSSITYYLKYKKKPGADADADENADGEFSVEFVQVKEKFGALRIYTNFGDDAIDSMISLAARLSQLTCDTCGSPGKNTLIRGWYQTLCEPCRADFCTKRGYTEYLEGNTSEEDSEEDE